MANWWVSKKLNELTPEQWEALCDGCGKCCMVKVEDEDTGELFATSLSCQLFDSNKCACVDYSKRLSKVPDCRKITAENVLDIPWLPKSCSYVLRAQGLELPEWHHLMCGDKQQVHTVGRSVRGRAIPLGNVNEDDIEDYILGKLV